MGQRLVLQPFFRAPGRQLHLGVGFVGRPRATIEVLANDRLMGRVVLDLPADDLGPVPFPVIARPGPTGPAPGRSTGRKGPPVKMLEPLGRQAVRFAPERQPDVGVGITSCLGRRRLVGGQFRGLRRGPSPAGPKSRWKAKSRRSSHHPYEQRFGKLPLVHSSNVMNFSHVPDQDGCVVEAGRQAPPVRREREAAGVGDPGRTGECFRSRVRRPSGRVG